MKLAAEEECKGFLLTCEQNREKQAIRDAYNFLGEFIEKVYPDLANGGKQLASLQDEIKEMRNKKSRVLFNLDTNVRCCIFIKINPEFAVIDPCRIVSEIMADMDKQERQLTRYCHRITPVEKAFKAEYFHMKDAVQELLAAKTKGEKHSWALNFKCRNNDKFKYKQVLKTVTEIAGQFGHFSDIYYPEWTISIEINHHLMCVSILEKFKESGEFKLRKINVQPLPPMKQDQHFDERISQPARQEVEVQRTITQEEVRPSTETPNIAHVAVAVVEQTLRSSASDTARRLLLEEKIQPKEDDAQLF